MLLDAPVVPLMEPAELGARIRELREAAGLSQAELAERLGIAQNSLSNWERGNRQPSFADIVRVAESLAVPISDFVVRPKQATLKPRGRGRPKKPEQ
jgi:transcriptional regulator with XRE-family HTH domain